MKTYNITDDADRMKVGKSIKHNLKANRKNGFYDWQWVENEDETIFEFYWNFIDVDYIFYVYSFMKSNEHLSPKLEGGTHDEAVQIITTRGSGGLKENITEKPIPQICLKLTVKNSNNGQSKS